MANLTINILGYFMTFPWPLGLAISIYLFILCVYYKPALKSFKIKTLNSCSFSTDGLGNNKGRIIQSNLNIEGDTD